MKILITALKTGDGKKVMEYTKLEAETENIKHELIELEPLEEKAGFTQEVVYDNKTNSYKFEYKAIPKSELEQLKDGLDVAMGSIVELTQAIAEGGGQ